MMHCRRVVLATLLLLVVIISAQAATQPQPVDREVSNGRSPVLQRWVSAAQSQPVSITSGVSNGREHLVSATHQHQPPVLLPRMSAAQPQPVAITSGVSSLSARERRLSTIQQPPVLQPRMSAALTLLTKKSEVPPIRTESSTTQRKTSSTFAVETSKAQDAALNDENAIVLKDKDIEMAVRLTDKIRQAVLPYLAVDEPEKLEKAAEQFADVPLRVARRKMNKLPPNMPYRPSLPKYGPAKLYTVPLKDILPLLLIATPPLEEDQPGTYRIRRGELLFYQKDDKLKTHNYLFLDLKESTPLTRYLMDDIADWPTADEDQSDSVAW